MDERQAELHAVYLRLAARAAEGGVDELADLAAFMAEHSAEDCGFD